MEELVVELDAIRADKGDDKRLPRPPGGIVVYFALATFAGVLGALAVRSPLDVEREVEPTEITKAPAPAIKDLWFEYTEEHGDQLVSVEDALSFAGKMIEEAESEAKSDPATSLAKARAAHAAASYAKLLLVSGGSSQMETQWAESLIAESEELSRSIQQSHPGW